MNKRAAQPRASQPRASPTTYVSPSFRVSCFSCTLLHRCTPCIFRCTCVFRSTVHVHSTPVEDHWTMDYSSHSLVSAHIGSRWSGQHSCMINRLKHSVKIIIQDRTVMKPVFQQMDCDHTYIPHRTSSGL